jgi:DNA-binding MarR family transcriptional regulator
VDLTHVQFVLLASTWWLNQEGRRPSQVEVAAFAGTDVKMTSQVVRELERRGLVERRADPSDARAQLVRATRQGARLAPRAIELVERVDRAFFRGVPSSDAMRVLRPLARL